MIYDWRANSLMAKIAVSISCCSAYPFRIFSRTKTDFLYSAIDALPFTFRIRFLGCTTAIDEYEAHSNGYSMGRKEVEMVDGVRPL